MAHPDLCFNCRHLVTHIVQTSVRRKDGAFEKAAWYECKGLGLPLPTISKYNHDYCRYYEQGEGVTDEVD